MIDYLTFAGMLVIALTVGLAALRLSRNLSHLHATKSASPAVDPVVAAELHATDIIEKARLDAERILKDAELRSRDEGIRLREEINRELDFTRNELREHERRAQKREDGVVEREKELARKQRQIENIQRKLSDRRASIDQKSREVDELLEAKKKQLHDITGMSREEAVRTLLHRLEEELTSEFAAKIRQHEARLKEEAESRSRDILVMAMQRYAGHQTTTQTVSTVDIPDDQMKGRIIGREGRNIRTFEKCTGVDVLVDDTPGVVLVSSFDNVRREIARTALARLIEDGRIHPTRIEEIVAEAQAEMERQILEIGKEAIIEADIPPIHEKLLQLLGRLKFRTSYSQNVLRHSIEVAHLAGMMASEIGLNAQLARRCGLLHDIGKAADHEMEGGHPKIGAELARRYGETSPEVLHAIAGHHDEITVDHVYTVLVAAADAISASRPGARRETLEKYVKRMEQLEAVARGFPEVESAYAIQAGRELRVIADARRASDDDAVRICHEIARAVERELDYPGEIKVTVIRETRVLETAK